MIKIWGHLFLLVYLFNEFTQLFAQQSAPPPVDRVAVGVAVGDRSKIYKGGNVPIPILPFFIMNKGRFYFQGISAGVTLYRAFPIIQVELSPHLMMLKDDKEITRGIKERRWTIHGGVKFTFPAPPPWPSVGIAYEHDLLKRHKGAISSLSLRRNFRFDEKIILTPSIALKYYDHRYIDYYFGIDQEEARPGRDVYLGRSAFEYGAGLTLGYLANDQLSYNLNGYYGIVDKRVANAPLVAHHYRYSWYAGIAHNL